MMSERDGCKVAKRENGGGQRFNGFHANWVGSEKRVSCVFTVQDEKDQLKINKQFHSGQGHDGGHQINLPYDYDLDCVCIIWTDLQLTSNVSNKWICLNRSNHCVN